MAARALLLWLALLLAGCDTLGWYTQAIGGQWEILHNQRDIEDLLEDPDTGSRLRARLWRVLDIRAFAASELHLPVADSYRRYVDLDRPYAVWNVFATPALSLTPVKWCYPIAGCVGYRGYFSEDSARRKAQSLRRRGLDVFVGGVSAYSTLGWFEDPVFSTIIDRPPDQLAALLFHELAHRRFYLPGDTAFNESFATAVEREGLRRWLSSQQLSGSEQARILGESHAAIRRQAQFVALVQDAGEQLRMLYASDRPEAEKYRRKAAIFDELREAYRQLRDEHWQGTGWYDGFFEGELNNASLITVSTYFDWVPAFERLLKDMEGSLPLFYAEVARIGELPEAERHRALRALMPASPEY